MYNVFIRPLKIEDATISWQWRNDAEIWKYTGARPDKEINYEIEKEWLLKVLVDKTSKRFAIIVDNFYVGNIQLTNLTSQDAQYHIFIGDKKYWGKGIAQLATYQLLTYANETLHLKEVYLHVNITNRAAVRVYEKSGFEKKQVVDENLKMICLLEALQQPTVSIFCMVYNHAKYIAECLNGLLMQKCNFKYVIVLGEDCSKDNSRNIILDFNKKYPGKFKLLLHDQNIGAHKNQDVILKNCHGKYIAICEGDDYWTDPLKLQKQVDFLEDNEEYSICSHDRNIVDESGAILVENELRDREIKDTYTQTVLFRNVKFDNLFYEYFLKAKNGDTFLFYKLRQLGQFKYLNFNGANYRVSDVGVWSQVSKGTKYEMTKSTISNMIEYYNKIGQIRHKKILGNWKADNEIIYAQYLLSEGKKKKALKHLICYNQEVSNVNFLNLFTLCNIKINLKLLINVIK